MKTVPSPQTSWLVFIAEAGFASWQPSAPRKSRVGFWITSEFRHARLRWRRPSSSNFPSPSNDHGQLKLRIGVSPSCCITPSHRAYFHPPPEKLRQTWAALAPSQHKTHYVTTSPHSAKPRRWPPDTCGMAFEKLILGERLFQGATASDVLAQVLTKEPDWERVPAKVRRLSQRCLEKDAAK